MAEAVDEVVVDHAGGLHEGVADGGAHKFETPGFEIFAHDVGFFGAGRQFGEGLPLVDDGFVPCELPDVAVEGIEFFLHFQEGPGVGDGSPDFVVVADDALVLQERLDLRLVVAGHNLRIEFSEGFAEVFPFFENGQPTQPRLKRVQYQKLKELTLVVNRHAPFGIMVFDHERMVVGPPTTDDFFAFHTTSI